MGVERIGEFLASWQPDVLVMEVKEGFGRYRGLREKPLPLSLFINLLHSRQSYRNFHFARYTLRTIQLPQKPNKTKGPRTSGLGIGVELPSRDKRHMCGQSGLPLQEDWNTGY